jgi:hypothetical protein
MTTLDIRVNKHLAGTDASGGAVGNVYQLPDPAASSKSPMKLVAGPVAIPVGPGQTYASVAVGPGDYLVQVRMPTGYEINTTVSVSAADPEPVQVTLEAERSPHEWLSVDHFLGRTASRFQYESGFEGDESGAAHPARARKKWAAKKRLSGARKKGGRIRRPSRVSFIREGTFVQSGRRARPEFDDLSRSEISQLKSEFPVWQVGAARPETPGKAPMDAESLDDLSRLRSWTGSLVSASRLSMTVTDEHFVKASVSLASSGAPDAAPADLQAAFSVAAARQYFVLLSQGKPSRLGVLPVPWQVVTTGSRQGAQATTELLIHYRSALRIRGKQDSKSTTEVQCGVSVDDPNVLAILGFLKNGNLIGTSALLAKAQETLFLKVLNPFAAAAAGYVLIQTHDPASTETQPQWQRWIGNLARWYRSIPDGVIQHGWLDLQAASQAQASAGKLKRLTTEARKRFEAARAHFIEAVSRGIPFYPQGVRMLVDGLNLVVENDARWPPAPDVKHQTATALAAAQWLALRTDDREVFTVLKLPEGKSDAQGSTRPAPARVSRRSRRLPVGRARKRA